MEGRSPPVVASRLKPQPLSVMVNMALDARPLVDGIAVSPQVSEADIAAAHVAGFRTIINNRPDGEEPGQLTAARAAEIAQGLGLTYIHQPVTSPALGDATAAAFAEAVAASPGPVLAHCRSGTRCTILWSLAEAKAGKRSPDEILRIAGAAGYDISAYHAVLDRLSQR